MEYIIFVAVVFFLVASILETWNHRKEKEKEENKEQLCSAIEAVILPSNMGKSIDVVKENLSKAEILIEYHIADDE